MNNFAICKTQISLFGGGKIWMALEQGDPLNEKVCMYIVFGQRKWKKDICTYLHLYHSVSKNKTVTSM